MRVAYFDERRGRIRFRGQFPRHVCARGHAMTDDNTITAYVKRDRCIVRLCKTCKREANRNHMRRVGAA